MANIQNQAEEKKKQGGSQDAPDRLSTRLIRPCDIYQDEYEQCRSSKGRRQQIFVHGSVLDCEPWKQDFANCQKWTWSTDENAARALIASERKRLDERLIPHLSTKVWSKRESPPEDWNKPLPVFEEMHKHSYLAQISKNGEESVRLVNDCSIQ